LEEENMFQIKIQCFEKSQGFFEEIVIILSFHPSYLVETSKTSFALKNIYLALVEFNIVKYLM
jgi:hypothetical protein